MQVFTVIFDQFNASLWNKSIHFIHNIKISLTPNLKTVVYHSRIALLPRFTNICKVHYRLHE